MKKSIIALLTVVTAAGLMVTGCAGSPAPSPTATGGFNTDAAITVVSRDAASGTRTAFQELMKITVKEGDTEKDNLVTSSLEFDSTDKVITAVQGDKNGIGYVSMGSLSDRVGTLNIDGVAPTVENVKNKSYKVSRPFIMVTKGEGSELVKDFITFSLSKQGQDIVSKQKYIISSDAAAEYQTKNLTGKIKIAGSTSIEPLMQVLMEEYKKVNAGVTFELQCQGSSQGIKGATDGTFDIGLSSRELKAEEKTALKENILALDGIAIIKNKENTTESLTSQSVTDIYTGVSTKWNQAK